MTSLKADYIFANAKVFTADISNPLANTVAIAGNKIIFVGSEADSKDLRSEQSQIIDCQQKTLMPGIIDSHFHLLWGALNLANIPLEGVKGIDNLRREVQKFKGKYPEKTVLRGSSLGYDVLPNNERLTRHHLDQIEKDVPLMLVAFDFHVIWCNTKAIEAAGVLHGPQSDSADVVMGADGLATGELREFEAMQLAFDLIPEPSQTEKNSLLQKAIQQANCYGITSIHNMNGDFDEFALYQKLDESKDLNLRIYMPYHMSSQDSLSVIEDKAIAMRESYKSPKLKAGVLKLFMDGVIESFTGFMLDPYINMPSTSGEAIFEAEHFNDICVEADKLGLQIAVHAIGDAAICRTLDGYEMAQQKNGKRDSRHRVEHVELLQANDFARFAELEVIPSMQPYHCTRPEVDYLMPYLDYIPQDRYQDSFAWQRLRDTISNCNSKLAFGSDWPVVSMNPFLGFDAAVNRLPWVEGLASQAQSLEDTLRSYTTDGAFVEFAEHDKGQLKVGMLADLALLSKNVFDMPMSDIQDLKVNMTVCDGIIVHES